jgi:hypothetical protein
MSTYYVNKYESIFDELFKKQKWEKVSRDSDKNEEESTNFSFIQYDTEQDSEKKLENHIKSKFYNKHTKFDLSIDISKEIKVSPEYKAVTVYILIVNSKEIYVYTEGKVYTDKLRFYSEQSYFHFTFQQIKKILYEKICEFLESDEKSEINEEEENNTTYQIFTVDFTINTENIVELLNINLEPDLSMEIDKTHKMKVHYWVWFDLLNKFVFKNTKKNRWCLLDDSVKNVDCENLKQKTFLINRSRILKNILLKNGWREGNKNELVDFSYWDIVDARGVRVNSKISTIPKNITNIIDNKLTMYTTLLENNLTDFLPKTYTKLKDIDPNIFNEDKIFFLKKHNGSGNKGVYVIKNYKEFTNIVKQNYSSYILQQEVPNLYLHNNKKTIIRSYGLVITNPFHNYLYYDAKFDIYKNNYSKTNLSNNIHNDEYNSVIHTRLIDTSFYSSVFEKMRLICNKLNIFWNYKTDKRDFIILGYDFILDSSYNPYLIEVNTYPNMAESKDQPIKNEIFKDFSNMFIFQNKLPHKFIDTI